jgi:hypothetical protein
VTHRLESRMREIRQSGSEGGVAGNGHPYPYIHHRANPNISPVGTVSHGPCACTKITPLGYGKVSPFV